MSRQLVIPERFIEATRDSGYKSTSRAICELIDNSLQAGATEIRISFERTGNPSMPVEVFVIDNGRGMSERELSTCLQFGGSSRFNDRSGLGRFGMGLPNASVSQARRVEVTTWQGGRGSTLQAYLDVDEISSGTSHGLTTPQAVVFPDRWLTVAKDHGTLVRWIRCDRLDRRKASTLATRVAARVGRVYRHAIWGGTRIIVNGAEVRPYDPLFLRPEGAEAVASVFLEPLVYDVEYTDPATGLCHAGTVTVTFTELPVKNWSSLNLDAKRRLGITKGAGVSVVRGDREIDHGWFLLGGKRRENYDDWWRCEIRFPPTLDDAFGITHTKQQIRPREWLAEIIETDMTEIARELSRRARDAHQANKELRQNLASKQSHDGVDRPASRIEGHRHAAPAAEVESGEATSLAGNLRPLKSADTREPGVTAAVPAPMSHLADALREACETLGISRDIAAALTREVLSGLSARREADRVD